VETACDVWLIATGAEERPYTGQADHLGARAAVARVKKRREDFRFVLSLDASVGAGPSIYGRRPIGHAWRAGSSRPVAARSAG